jgi:ferredoxin
MLINPRNLLNHEKAKAIVVGSGPSALSAIKVLIESGIKPLVLDVGITGESSSDTNYKEKNVSLSPGRKSLFGSYFPYDQVQHSNVLYKGIEPSISFAKGGLSNVWGATVNSNFESWPGDLMPSSEDIQTVESILPISQVGEEAGQLNPGWLAIKQGNSIRKIFSNRRWNVSKAKLSISQSGPNSCIRCGMCIEGCPRNSIWNSRFEIEQLIAGEQIDYRDGAYVNKLIHSEGIDYIEVINNRNEFEYFTSELLFIGAGTISTAAILIRSGVSSRIEISDSSTAYSAILKPFRRKKNSEGISLSHTWLSDKNLNSTHQFYAPSTSNAEKIGARIPKFLRFGWLINLLSDSIFPLISYLPDEESGKVIIEDVGGNILVSSSSGKETEKMHRRSSISLSLRLLRHGYILIPFVTTITSPGSGYHSGRLSILNETDFKFGSVRQFPTVSLIDASSLYRIPVGSITPNVMLNAARITRERVGVRENL